MSIKTLRKRIALVAVSALGVGLLSVTPASAAVVTEVAGYPTLDISTVTNSCSIINGATGTVYVAASQDVTGFTYDDSEDTAVFYTAAAPKFRKGDTVTVTGTALTVAAKIVTDVDSNSTGGYSFSVNGNFGAADDEDLADAGTATVIDPAMSRTVLNYSNALLDPFDILVADNDYMTLNGAPGSVLGGVDGDALNANGGYDFQADGTTVTVTLPAGYLGTFTITSYGTSTTRATALSTLTVNVKATCEGASTPSAGDSFVEVNTLQAQADSNVDVATTTSAGTYLYANIVLNNSIGNPVAAGLWAATVTNGAKVSLTADGSAPGTPTYAFVTAAGTGEEVTAKVDGGKAGAYNSTTLTVTYNGAVVTTKNLTFLGEATKINVIKTLSGELASDGYFFFTLTDAAGNQVPGSVELDSLTASARTPSITEVDPASPLEPSAAIAGLGIGTHTYGVVSFSCVAATGSGSTDLTIKHTSDYNENVLTATVKAVCAGPVDTFTVSMDKASYKIGEIATMTITAKDASGAVVADTSIIGDAGSITVSAGGMEQIGSASDNDTFTSGVKTYRFQVTTAGTFNGVASITGTTTKSATAAYTVGSDGAVSNAEVLAAIVKLIASINKQIKALQKSLKR